MPVSADLQGAVHCADDRQLQRSLCWEKMTAPLTRRSFCQKNVQLGLFRRLQDQDVLYNWCLPLMQI
jgi:hypothetical protein